MIQFNMDTSIWCFPICLEYQAIGSKHKPFFDFELRTFEVKFLCFSFMIALEKKFK